MSPHQLLQSQMTSARTAGPGMLLRASALHQLNQIRSALAVISTAKAALLTGSQTDVSDFGHGTWIPTRASHQPATTNALTDTIGMVRHVSQ